MTSGQDNLPQILALIFVILITVSIHRRRQAIRLGLRRIILVGLVYVGIVLTASKSGWPPAQAIIAGILGGLVVDSMAPRGSRYIPKCVRRQVIARWELETGRKFNPKIHELDHVIPFSKGGGSTEENLRVITRKENRAKRAKSPWWDVLK